MPDRRADRADRTGNDGARPTTLYTGPDNWLDAFFERHGPSVEHVTRNQLAHLLRDDDLISICPELLAEITRVATLRSLRQAAVSGPKASDEQLIDRWIELTKLELTDLVRESRTAAIEIPIEVPP